MPMRDNDDGPDYQGGTSEAEEIERLLQDILSEHLPGVKIYRHSYRPIRTLVGDRITELFGKPLRRDEEESVYATRRPYVSLSRRDRHRRGDTEPMADSLGPGEDAAPASDETLFDC